MDGRAPVTGEFILPGWCPTAKPWIFRVPQTKVTETSLARKVDQQVERSRNFGIYRVSQGVRIHTQIAIVSGSASGPS